MDWNLRFLTLYPKFRLLPCFTSPNVFHKLGFNPGSIFFFANITTIENVVGLLNRKMDISALDLETEQKIERGASGFWS